MTASVLAAAICPAATLVIVLSAPVAPTLTVELGVVPAKLYVVPFSVTPVVATAAEVTDPDPRATALVFPALAPKPIAVPPSAVAVAVEPMAVAFVPEAHALAPNAAP